LPETAFLEENNYQIIETKDYLLLEPFQESIEEAILFIPGGLVDPHAYIPTFKAFVVEHRMKVLILKVRSNLAIFNINQASRVRKSFEDNKWLIGGHSLGGVVAAMEVGANENDYEGLFLLGSYSSTDINNWDEPVFSILAENDGLTEQSSVETNAENLPEGIFIDALALGDLGDSHGKTIYYTIKGGNHAQFGTYGFQNGDGMATISAETQQLELFEVLSILMRNNGFNI